MSDKTFWSILGGLLVGWVALLYVLVIGGKMQDYDKVSSDLDSKVDAMKRYSKNAPEELPTEELLGRKERFIKAYESNVEQATDFFTNRERRIDSEIRRTSKDLWLANYRDERDALKRRLEELHGEASEPANGRGRDEALSELKGRLLNDLPRAERIWRTQRMLVEAVIEAEGKLVSCGTLNDKNQERREPFVIDTVVLQAEIPAAAIPPILESSLTHSDLTLEIERLTIGKDAAKLTPELVVELPSPDAAGPEEPPVLMKLTLNILKYSPTPQEEEEE